MIGERDEKGRCVAGGGKVLLEDVPHEADCARQVEDAAECSCKRAELVEDADGYVVLPRGWAIQRVEVLVNEADSGIGDGYPAR